MIIGKTEAETLKLNVWGVGSILVGYEGNMSDRILITAVGEERFLCRWFYNGKWGRESGQTTLGCRDWKLVENTATDSGLSAEAGSIPPSLQAILGQVSDRHAEAALAWAKEDARLSRLPLLDLIREVLLSDAGDSLLVLELMNRACPKWAEQIIEEG